VPADHARTPALGTMINRIHPSGWVEANLNLAFGIETLPLLFSWHSNHESRHSPNFSFVNIYVDILSFPLLSVNKKNKITTILFIYHQPSS